MPRLLVFGDSNSALLANAITALTAAGAFPLPGGWTFTSHAVGGQAAGLPSPATPSEGKANVLATIASEDLEAGDVCFVCYGTVEALNEAFHTFDPEFGPAAHPEYTPETGGAACLEIAAAITGVGATCVLCRPIGCGLAGDLGGGNGPAFWHHFSAGSHRTARMYRGYTPQLSYWVSQTKAANWNADHIHAEPPATRAIALRILRWLCTNHEDWA